MSAFSLSFTFSFFGAGNQMILALLAALSAHIQQKRLLFFLPRLLVLLTVCHFTLLNVPLCSTKKTPPQLPNVMQFPFNNVITNVEKYYTTPLCRLLQPEALCFFDRQVQFLLQLRLVLVRRQIDAIEAAV